MTLRSSLERLPSWVTPLPIKTEASYYTPIRSLLFYLKEVMIMLDTEATSFTRWGSNSLQGLGGTAQPRRPCEIRSWPWPPSRGSCPASGQLLCPTTEKSKMTLTSEKNSKTIEMIWMSKTRPKNLALNALTASDRRHRVCRRLRRKVRLETVVDNH